MNPDISAVPMNYLYFDHANDRSRFEIVDRVTKSGLPNRVFMQKWVARDLNKPIKRAKLSVFIDVKDGVCLQDSNLRGFAVINHHNLVAILQINRSMLESKLLERNIVVITFSPEAVVAIREFISSEGLNEVSVDHIDCENIKSTRLEKSIAIIDYPFTGHPKDINT